MCRWLAYSGDSIHLDELVLKTEHSLIDQSLCSHSSDHTTNGDGFGLGWYGNRPEPALYRHTQPAWNDANLHDLAAQVESSLFIAHVRAATGTAVQQTNCHPFRHGRWLFVHNGLITGFSRVRRDLMMLIDPDLFSCVVGTTDSEIMFYLALTYGLDDEPLAAIARMSAVVELIGAEHGIEHPLQMTLGLSDGINMYAARYSTERRSRSLFHSRVPRALCAISPGLTSCPRNAVTVVSEPLTDLADDWCEIEESTAISIVDGNVQRTAFEPAHAFAVETAKGRTHQRSALH